MSRRRSVERSGDESNKTKVGVFLVDSEIQRKKWGKQAVGPAPSQMSLTKVLPEMLWFGFCRSEFGLFDQGNCSSSGLKPSRGTCSVLSAVCTFWKSPIRPTRHAQSRLEAEYHARISSLLSCHHLLRLAVISKPSLEMPCVRCCICVPQMAGLSASISAGHFPHDFTASKSIHLSEHRASLFKELELLHLRCRCSAPMMAIRHSFRNLRASDRWAHRQSSTTLRLDVGRHEPHDLVLSDPWPNYQIQFHPLPPRHGNTAVRCPFCSEAPSVIYPDLPSKTVLFSDAN